MVTDGPYVVEALLRVVKRGNSGVELKCCIELFLGLFGKDLWRSVWILCWKRRC